MGSPHPLNNSIPSPTGPKVGTSQVLRTDHAKELPSPINPTSSPRVCLGNVVLPSLSPVSLGSPIFPTTRRKALISFLQHCQPDANFPLLATENRGGFEPVPPRKQLPAPLSAYSPQLPLSFGPELHGMSRPLTLPSLAQPHPISSSRNMGGD